MKYFNIRKILLTLILILAILSFNGCSKDEEQYNSAITKINELYSMYNDYTTIDKDMKFSESDFGDYVNLIEIEKDYLLTEQKTEITLTEEIEKVMYFKMSNYDKDEIEDFNNSVKNIKTVLADKVKSSESTRKSYLKKLKNLEINEDKKNSYIESAEKRLKIEEEYLSSYDELLGNLVEKMEERGEIYKTISENKDDTKYDLKALFDKLSENDDEQQKITNKIIEETENYDEKISNLKDNNSSDNSEE
jgi:hypothetical protein